MASSRASIPFIWLIRIVYTFALVGVIFASIGAMGIMAFELQSQGRIYPGVRACGIDLSDMTPTEAAFALAKAFDYPQNPAFIFWEGERKWTATPSELGVSFNLAATVTAAYSVGRSGNWLTDLETQFYVWYTGAQISPVLVYDENRAIAYLNNIAAEVFVPAQEAALQTSGTQVITTQGRVGRQVDVLAAVNAVRPYIFALDRTQISLNFIETPPLVLDTSAQAAAAQSILSQPFTLNITDTAGLTATITTWTIDQPTLAAMLRVQRVTDSPTAAHYDVSLAPESLRAFIQPIAKQVDLAEVRNARFYFDDETKQLVLLEHARAARRLDVESTLLQINQALAQGAHTAPLAFQIIPPQVSDDATAEQLGIRELVSEQSTYFLGSGAERINNIKVAASRFHGLLIPPNAVFSFDEQLGDVSLDQGYAEALIIYGGRTIRGVGGGVCQVSSTIFRAAYFGGYPIVERNSHAYRVGYYERNVPGKWSGPGLDATVFAPLVDFKFRNDTPYWLLMEVYVYPGAGRITWKFYSTSDGRQITVAPPVVSNEVPAPEPLYEEDPELPAGEIKQVDYAAVGADVIVRRTITRDGVVVNVNEGPIETHYQPWRAIYHYGPGTPNIPTPTPPTPTP